MYFIAKNLEILKGEIALHHEESLAGLASCSVPLKKTRTWTRGKPTNMDDVVK
jgi:hypothetical protein